jgi:cytochrome c-type biogenesis protein CcmH/NrfG
MSAVARRYFKRGKAALDRGDVEGAMESLKSAVDLVPTFVDARLAYAVALCRFGDCPRAAQLVRAGLGRRASSTGQAALWACLGDALTRGHDFPGAEDAFKQAEQVHGFEARAAGGLARVYAKQGRYAESFAQLKRASELARD